MHAHDMGCYFSINTEMMKNDKHIKMIRSLPIDRLLTETDGPFTQINGNPSSPTDITDTIKLLSNILEIKEDDIALQIRNNVSNLLAYYDYQQF